MKNLIVKKIKNKGKGVFAGKDFKKDEIILIPRGKLYNRKEFFKQSQWTRDHSAQIGENLFMGPARDIEDYVNHSCEPNAGHVIKGRKSKFTAIKNIKKGDEITFDYSTTMLRTDEKWKCNCGSKNCRKIIKDFNFLPKRLQNKYIKLGIVPKYIIEAVKK